MSKHSHKYQHFALDQNHNIVDIKNAVENMTGLEVSAVNINVQGITFNKKENAKVEISEEE